MRKKASEVEVFKSEATTEETQEIKDETKDAKEPAETKEVSVEDEAVKPTKTRAKAKAKVEEPEASDEVPDETEPAEAALAESDESPEDAEKETEAPKKAPAARRSGRILTAERGVNTNISAPRQEAEMFHFYESAKYNRDPMHRPVFYGCLIGLGSQTVNGKKVPFALVEHKSAQLQNSTIIYVPATEIVSGEDKLRDENISYAVNAMLGAIVEFVVTEVIREFKMIIGSRKLAMKRLQRTYYGGESPQIFPNRRIEARVMSVSPRRLVLDAFGVETVLTRPNDFRWDFIESFVSAYTPGDKVLVRVVDVGEKNGELSVNVSARVEAENPDEANLRYVSRGATLLGVVTGFSSGIYFVRLHVGVNVIAHVVQGNSVRAAVGDEVKVSILSVSHSQCQAKGKIVAVF